MENSFSVQYVIPENYKRFAMLQINDSLTRIEQSIEKLDDRSSSQILGGRLNLGEVFSKLSTLYKSREKHLIAVIKDYTSAIDKFEKIPVLFNASTELLQEQKAIADRFIHLRRSIKPLLAQSQNPILKRSWAELTTRTAALQYRLEEENGGLDKGDPDEVLAYALAQAAIKWKLKDDMMVDKGLSQAHIDKLITASCYPKFAKATLADKKLLDRFFTWALRDNNGVDQFVQFPSISGRVKSSFIGARVGRFGGTMFKIEKTAANENESGVQQKVITLPFYINHKTEQVSILDESREVDLSGWRLTIKQVMTIFSKKNREIGNLEYFGTRGIANWNSHQLGTWDPATGKFTTIDATADNWWEQLPVLEELSKEELEARYNVQLEEGEWLACAKSSRSTPDQDVDGRHGYVEVSIPTKEGNYRVFPFGNFAAHFPHGVIELLGFLVATVVAKIAYPDENNFYSQRQQASYPIKLLEEEGEALMHKIQIDIIKAKHNFMIFQFGAQNCAYWAQKILHAVRDNLPNFFKIPVVESDPQNTFLKGLFKAVRASPKMLQNKIVYRVERILGSSQGMNVYWPGGTVFQSHRTSKVSKDKVMYQPGLLHQQIQDKELEGTVTYGHV